MKKQIVYINILRILACFMVIVNHTNSYILEYDNLYNNIFYCISFALCKIGVPVFLMISGALILDKSYDLKKVWKCITRILVPLVIISFALYIKRVGFHGINIGTFLETFFQNPIIIHYWYLYALIGNPDQETDRKYP